jgi:hypothetical protein
MCTGKNTSMLFVKVFFFKRRVRTSHWENRGLKYWDVYGLCGAHHISDQKKFPQRNSLSFVISISITKREIITVKSFKTLTVVQNVSAKMRCDQRYTGRQHRVVNTQALPEKDQIRSSRSVKQKEIRERVFSENRIKNDLNCSGGSGHRLEALVL